MASMMSAWRGSGLVLDMVLMGDGNRVQRDELLPISMVVYKYRRDK